MSTGALRQLGLKINDIEINPAYVNSGPAVYSMNMRVVNPELKSKSHKELIDAISAMETVVYAEEIFLVGYRIVQGDSIYTAHKT